MPELSAYILSYNSAGEIPALMDSLKGIRDIVVLDDGSTDGTVAMFRARGARVIEDKNYGKDAATEADVAEFTTRYGFAPEFVAGEIFSNASERRNYAASLCKNDWVVNPDHDERPEWDLKKVKARMKGQEGLRHRYIFKHNPDGSPLIEFIQCKLYNRRHGEFTGRVHEVVVNRERRTPVRSEYCPEFVMHHWQKESPHRATHLKQMEFQVVKDETVRNLHYLGREYADKKEWQKALKIYERYFSINTGDFPEQMSQAYLVQAECCRHLDRIGDAVAACLNAVPLDYSRRDAFFFLGQLYESMNNYKAALIWFSAANVIPFNPQGYMNDMRLYTWSVHDKLSVCYQRLGMLDVARMHWLEALKHLPDGPEGARILANGRWMFPKEEAKQ